MNFKKFNISSYIYNIFSIIYRQNFKGWGRKKTGRFASYCHTLFGGKLTLYEDGFIRSLGLGVNGSPSFSLVEDDVGIYYDATSPSKLENILNSYDFSSDSKLMKKAHEAIELIKKYNISKYNNAKEIDKTFFKNTDEKRVLVIAQTAGDMSLKYGLCKEFGTDEIIQIALKENPDTTIYLKIHPDVLSGKKESDIDIEKAKQSCVVIDENINPLSLLKHFSKVYTKTSQMGFEALLVGCETICFGMPFYAGWGVSDDRVVCERRKRKLSIEEIFAGAYILYSKYYNPYTKKDSDIIDTIKTISELKNRYDESTKHLFFGFSGWKHNFIKPYFSYVDAKNILFINPFFKQNYFDLALQKGLDENSIIYIWGRKNFPQIEKFATKNSLKVYRVEDGFIRSVGLGSDLTQPYSLVIDSRGIYFDPTKSSDLEKILETATFDEEVLDRAKKLRAYLVEKKLSKYNLYKNKKLDIPHNKKVVLVPGQVEDDASIKFGASGMSNLELLKQSRQNAKDAYIIYKPHPDVLVGNRVGFIEEKQALLYADKVVTKVGIDSVLEVSDEVHTMTSLVGFEALMREKKVFTYGMPFYGGWGLTNDTKISPRRTKRLKLDELVAATLLIYPKYIYPKSHTVCEIEELLRGLEEEKRLYDSFLVYRVKLKIRNFTSRKLQQFLRIITLKN